MKENILERALRLAASEPAHRPEFYSLLLESTVLVLGSSDQRSEGQITLEAGSQIEIQKWLKSDGTSVIPFFSSLQALERATSVEQHYIALPARSLFEFTIGTALVLNPGSESRKEFSPTEVEALLSVGMNRLVSPRVAQKASSILLGQPKNYPDALVASLTKLFSEHSNVNVAYLAQMYDRSVDSKPHLLVGIEADDDFEDVIRESAAVAGDMSDGESMGQSHDRPRAHDQ